MIGILLLVAAIAVSRITYFLTDDYLSSGYRRWVVNKWGDDSKMSYLVHCPWCTSIWVALVVMPMATFTILPWNHVTTWVLTALSIPAASMVSGLLIELADRKG